MTAVSACGTLPARACRRVYRDCRPHAVCECCHAMSETRSCFPRWEYLKAVLTEHFKRRDFEHVLVCVALAVIALGFSLGRIVEPLLAYEMDARHECRVPASRCLDLFPCERSVCVAIRVLHIPASRQHIHR